MGYTQLNACSLIKDATRTFTDNKVKKVANRYAVGVLVWGTLEEKVKIFVCFICYIIAIILSIPGLVRLDVRYFY